MCFWPLILVSLVGTCIALAPRFIAAFRARDWRLVFGLSIWPFGLLVAIFGASSHYHYWKAYEDGLELNEQITEQELVGEWRLEDEVIRFQPGGAVEGTRTGHWHFDSQRRPEVNGQVWLPVSRRGELLLMPPEARPDFDPDSWWFGRVFARVSPGPVTRPFDGGVHE